jgi:branched-chain amino acid transport system ATP-binding protein
LILTTEKLTVRFGGLLAVNNVDVQIAKGESVGLIGPNGSGKTTFFNLITGIYKPSHGNVVFNGHPIMGLHSHEITRRGIARTFQNSRLFLDLSVLDNILIGMHSRQKTNWWRAVLQPGQSRRELLKGIEKTRDLFDFFHEKRLLENLRRKARELPQADKRRLEICRALASDPFLLLLDEPSAGMNPNETTELMEDIKRIRDQKKEITIVVVEHDMKVIRGLTERVIVFNYGSKIAEGPYEQISKNQDVISAYLGEEVR